MPTILLLGCNGQLGFEMQRTLAPLGKLVVRDFPDIDYIRPESLRVLVRDVQPDIIINTAAYTAVDKAEGEPEKVALINAVAPGVLAEEAATLGAIFVHYSTDYVFDGTKKGLYLETDQTNPLSVYGRTKRDGEIAAAKAPKHLVFRTSWVVGAHGANFIKTILKLAAERETLRVVADQYGAPTSARLLATVTVAVLRQLSDVAPSDDRWGMYHLVAGGETSWNGLARYVIAGALKRGWSLKAQPETVTEITTAEYPTPAKRPANSRLSTKKISRSFGCDLAYWTDGVDGILNELTQNTSRR